MANTLILSNDEAAARARALEQLDALGDSDKAFVYVTHFKAEGDREEDIPSLEGFDSHREATILGSRLAQQCSWVDAVLAEGLERWAVNLHLRYPGDTEKIDSERISLLAVLDNGMADIVLISKPVQGANIPEPDAQAFLEKTLTDLREKVDEVIEI